MECAWGTGNLELLFLNEINRHNPNPALARIEATDPRGEQPLLHFESCTLESINPALFARGYEINCEGAQRGDRRR